MAGFVPWLTQNWLPLLQAVGIIGGLCFTAASIRRDTKARRASDILALSQQHRDLWGELYKQPELQRVLDPACDLILKPISPLEEEFLNSVIVHFYTGWLLSKGGALALLPVSALQADVLSFFKLPIPKAVWSQSKLTRDPEFVRFIESCRKQEVPS